MHLHPDQQRAEDQALDAAHADRTRGKTTIVIAQTSNEHLDELNARAQAIRRQHGQLGAEAIPLAGRPHELHEGDQVQVRRTIHHEQGQLRNGTNATIARVDPGSGRVDLRLADGTEIRLERRELARADLRLAYVQHPFPAQGQTTDTAHLIVAGTATREGTYVPSPAPETKRISTPATPLTAPPKPTASKNSPIELAVPNQSSLQSTPRSPTKPRSSPHPTPPKLNPASTRPSRGSSRPRQPSR